MFYITQKGGYRMNKFILVATIAVALFSILHTAPTSHVEEQIVVHEVVVEDEIEITAPDATIEKPIQETVPEKPFIASDPSITWEYAYVDSTDGIIPYGLYTPSTAATNDKTPLIVWFHGAGEKAVPPSAFESAGLPAILNNWDLHGFNAYVVCPQLKGDFNTRAWMTDEAVENVRALIMRMINMYSIDTDKIILCGHSLGGQGTTYIASKMPDMFSCVAVLSGYTCWQQDLTIDIPMQGYVGICDVGESEDSYYYMVGSFMKEYPQAEVFVVNTSHGELPYRAFTRDLNEDNKSDLVEWMLYQ